jgi:hypothetical protein
MAATSRSCTKIRPPYLNGHTISVFNNASLLALSPLLVLPLAPCADGSTQQVIVGLESHDFDVQHSSGVLLPLQRMQYISAAMRRMRVELDFSLVVSLPVDKFHRPIVHTVARHSPPTASTEQRTPQAPASMQQFILIRHDDATYLKHHIR